MNFFWTFCWACFRGTLERLSVFSFSRNYLTHPGKFAGSALVLSTIFMTGRSLHWPCWKHSWVSGSVQFVGYQKLDKILSINYVIPGISISGHYGVDFLLSHIPLKFISLSKPLHAQNIEFEKSVDTQWIVTAVCLIPQLSPAVFLFSAVVLYCMLFDDKSLTCLGFFLLLVSTQLFSPPHHPQHRMKYVCTHAPVFPPCFPKPVTPCCWQLSCSKSTYVLPTHNQTAGPEFWKYIRGMWYSRSINTFCRHILHCSSILQV